jgi:Gas vesicle synthesis protein GvpL/GvpF
MDQSSIYLYCLARANSVQNLTIEGLDGGGPVTGLEVGDVAALISRVPLCEFDHAAAAGVPQDAAWVVPRACRHEQVIEAAMKLSPVLPVRFGAVFSSCDALVNFVSDHYDRMAGFLDWVADKEEWSVKAFVNLEASSEWAISSDRALADEWQRLPESPGTRYFLEKRLKAAARRRAILSSREAADEICEALLACAIEIVRLPPSGEPGTGKEPVLNLALLVRSPAVNELQIVADALNSRFQEQGVSVECRGPWAPFHFCPSLDRKSP